MNFSLRFNRRFLASIVAFLLSFNFVALGAIASLDDQYLKILTVIEQADNAAAENKVPVAKSKYEQAFRDLNEIKRANPAWNAKAVAFRLKYVTDKLAALTPPATQPAPTAPAPAESEAKPLPEAAPLPAGTQIKVISVGNEPRAPLRFQTKPGDKQTAVFSVSSSMGMGAGDAPLQTTKLPIMKMTVTLVTKNVSPEGDIDYEAVVDDFAVEGAVGVPVQVTEAMKEALKGLQGLHVLASVTDRGVKKNAEAQIPSDVDAQTRAAMEQVKQLLTGAELLFPHEPVGPNAKWEVRQKVTEQGMAIDQTATHTLVSVEGDVLNIKSVITQTASNQEVPNPMAPGTTANLVKLTGSGAATTKISLANLLPINSNVEDHMTTLLSMEVGTQKQNFTMKTDSTIRVEGK